MKRPEPPQPEKPIADMTSEELAAFRAKLRREINDRAVVTGTRKPRTMREAEIWHQALAERDERRARRVTRAERGASETDTGPTQE